MEQILIQTRDTYYYIGDKDDYYEIIQRFHLNNRHGYVVSDDDDDDYMVVVVAVVNERRRQKKMEKR